MRLFTFGPYTGIRVDHFGSDFVLAPPTNPEAATRVACLHLAPGGVGTDRCRHPTATSEAAYWIPGEVHATGTTSGMTAFVLEGHAFEVWAEPLPDRRA